MTANLLLSHNKIKVKISPECFLHHQDVPVQSFFRLCSSIHLLTQSVFACGGYGNVCALYLCSVLSAVQRMHDGTFCVCVQLIERAGRAADDEKVEQKMAESWEELSLVSASPTMIRKGLEGVVMKHVAKAAKQQKGIDCTSGTKSVQANVTKIY